MTMEGLQGTLFLEYTTDSVTYMPLDTITAITGTSLFNWRIPDEPTTTGYLRVLLQGSALVRSSQFQISRTPFPRLTLLRPVYAVPKLYASRPVTVQWYAMDIPRRVCAEYSPDSGATWQLLGVKTSARGYDSIVATLGPERTTRAKFRVRLEDSSIVSESDALTVYPLPRLTLVRPSGGETFLVGETAWIVWNGLDLSADVSIAYSRDDGAYWFPIDSRDARNGLDSMPWEIPPPVDSNVVVRIMTDDSLAIDTSGAFVIRVQTRTGETETTSRTLVLESVRPDRPSGILSINWWQPIAGSALIRLIALDGSIARTRTINAGAPGAHRATLDCRTVSSGAYVLEIALAGMAAWIIVRW